jgi:periplasmic divalent cation tolerance protein
MGEHNVVLVTASTEEEAVQIARALVESRLAGCVNIIQGVRSIYRWQGKVEDKAEVLMIMKTKRGLFDELTRRVKELHSYTVPEIISLPITEGSEEYIEWLDGATLKHSTQ